MSSTTDNSNKGDATKDDDVVTTNSNTTDHHQNNKLRPLNYANVAAFVWNCLVTFAASPLTGLPDNATLSNKYQTLMTPAPYAFAIWGVIFVSQFIWTIGQCLPKYRSSDLVVTGVGCNFIFACAAQCIWTIVFGMELLPLSLIAMVSILIPLVLIVDKISDMPTPTNGQYWLLKFPFEIHAGWIIAATVVNANVLVVAYDLSLKYQRYFVGYSLHAILGVGLSFTILREYKQHVITCVMIWALFGIRQELENPRDTIKEKYKDGLIDEVQLRSTILGIVFACFIIIQILRIRFFSTTTNDNSNDDDGSSSDSSSKTAPTTDTLANDSDKKNN